MALTDDMSQIEIARAENAWVDRVRAYKAVIDGEVVGRVERGHTISIPVTPGRHDVWMKIDWCRSPKLSLDVGPHEAVRLECGPNANPLTVLVYATVYATRYLWLRISEPRGVPPGN